MGAGRRQFHEQIHDECRTDGNHAAAFFGIHIYGQNGYEDGAGGSAYLWQAVVGHSFGYAVMFHRLQCAYRCDCQVVACDFSAKDGTFQRFALLADDNTFLAIWLPPFNFLFCGRSSFSLFPLPLYIYYYTRKAVIYNEVGDFSRI